MLFWGGIGVAYADTWLLVTDASTLQAGDQVVIASRERERVAADIVNGVMTVDSASVFSGDSIVSLGRNAVVLTLGGEKGRWTLADKRGKLLGTTSKRNVAWDNGTTTWSITIGWGDATIQSTQSTCGRILYNANSPRFTTYTSQVNTFMLLPQLYRLADVSGYTFMYEGYVGNTTRCDGGRYCAAGDVITISAGTPTKQGFTFGGWSYDSKTYMPGDTFTMPAANVVMVPVWHNDGSGVDAPHVSVRTQKVMRDGYLYIIVGNDMFDTMGRKQSNND